jgi:phospholipid-binding lipoprotein MlaA
MFCVGPLKRLLLALLFATALAACAGSPKPETTMTDANAVDEVNDPIEPFNRYMFEVNKFIDELLLKPFATVYRGVLPDPVQTGVRNVLNNLDTPLTFIHDVAQGEPERAGEAFGRFSMNTLLGVGGIFDVAAGEPGKEGIPYHQEDLGQTLAVWGVPDGPYLVLPLLGPSNARDAVGIVGDFFINPFAHIGSRDTQKKLTVSRTVFRVLDVRSRNIETLEEIERASIDYYASIRSLYRQRRNAEILNGKVDEDSVPDISIDEEDE